MLHVSRPVLLLNSLCVVDMTVVNTTYWRLQYVCNRAGKTLKYLWLVLSKQYNQGQAQHNFKSVVEKWLLVVKVEGLELMMRT